MEFREAFFVGFIRIFLKRKLDEINYLGGVSTVESSNTVVELGYTAGQASDGKLGLDLSKLNSSIICPELWKLEFYSVDAEGDSGLGSGESSPSFGHLEDRFLLAERKHCPSSKLEASQYEESKDRTQTN